MLSNVPQTPKIVNASFLAFFNDSDFVFTLESAKKLTNYDYSQTHLPLTPRRKPRFLNDVSQKMFSLDEFSQSLPNQNRNKNFLTVLNLDGQENEETSNGTDSSKSETSSEPNNSGNYQATLTHPTNGNNALSPNSTVNSNPNGFNSKKTMPRKQTSLDSKIEHIFEEAVNISNTVTINTAVDNEK
jgi:hypothetical protein